MRGQIDATMHCGTSLGWFNGFPDSSLLWFLLRATYKHLCIVPLSAGSCHGKCRMKFRRLDYLMIIFNFYDDGSSLTAPATSTPKIVGWDGPNKPCIIQHYLATTMERTLAKNYEMLEPTSHWHNIWLSHRIHIVSDTQHRWIPTMSIMSSWLPSHIYYRVLRYGFTWTQASGRR